MWCVCVCVCVCACGCVCVHACVCVWMCHIFSPLFLYFLVPSVQYYKKRKKYLCHDENEECRDGDLVRIKECRPLSKRKHFQVEEIVEKAEEYTNPLTGKTFTKTDL